MSATCVLCGSQDWVGTGMCSPCAGHLDRRLVFVAPQPTAMGHADVIRNLRELLNAPRTHDDFVETARGRKPLAIVPAALTGPALRKLEGAGLQGRVLRFHEWPRALPPSFVLMAVAVLVVGILAGLRGVPMLVWASPLAAVLLLFGAAMQLTRPLLAPPVAPSVLPRAVRAALAESLAILSEGRARSLLLDIARLGESTFVSLSPAFRSASLGESVLELLSEAGPLALEAAQLEIIANDLKQLAGGPAVTEYQRASAAVQDHFALLEHVIALLGRIAREGADSHGEMSELVQRVRAEAAHRLAAEQMVASLLENHPGELSPEERNVP
jgi:hypothetical protein